MPRPGGCWRLSAWFGASPCLCCLVGPTRPPFSFHLGLSRCRLPSGWHGLFCLAPIFLWSFCVDVCSPVCTVLGVLRAVLVECMSCVWQHVCASGQWMCLRLSGVRLLPHFNSCEPFHSRIPLFVAPVRTYFMSPNGWLLASVALVGLCISMWFCRCSSLCRFIVCSIP